MDDVVLGLLDCLPRLRGLLDELVAPLRDNANHPWKPPGGGYEAFCPTT